MSMFKLLSALKRVAINDRICSSISNRSVSTDSPLCFQVTQYLCGEPLKKKKKLDPAIVRAREEKRRRRLEKQIRRLQKNARQPKPLDECEIPLVLVNADDLKIRERKPPQLSEEVVDERVRLMKDWARFRYRQTVQDCKMIDRLIYSQERALNELRQESEELYQEAIQIDPGFIPFTAEGPVFTPPIKDYDSPDGEYVDISKKWT